MTPLAAPEWPDGPVGDEWVAAEQSVEVRFPCTGGLVAREALLPALLSRPERVVVGGPRSEDTRVSALDDCLHASVDTASPDTALTAIDRVEAGGVVIEVAGFRSGALPYGGVTDAGVGREGPRFAIEDPTVTRPASIRPTTRKADS